MDPYQWAKENNIYMSQDELATLLQTNNPSLLVIDVRNEDNGGGRIAKSIHMPDGPSFSALRVADISLHGNADEEEDVVVQKDILVFHCMESARRGPRCAKQLVDFLAAVKTRYGDNMTVADDDDD
eukprot:12669250-Ditylum_brightwellii.AAC.1